MTRLIGPSESSRLAFTVVTAYGATKGLLKAKALRAATYYVDPDPTATPTPAMLVTLADVRHLDGSPITGSTVTTDAFGLLPLMQFPDGSPAPYTLLVTVDGGVTAARVTADRTDELADAITDLQNAGPGGAETPSGAQAKADAAEAAAIAAAADDATAKANAAVNASASRAANLSDLASASTARTNLGLGDAATKNTGTAAGTLAAGDDGRITGAAQKSSNLSDLGSASAARTNLGLGDAAAKSTGTTAGTLAAGDDGRITGAAQKSSNLSDLASASTARTNLGLGNVSNTSDAAKPVSTAQQTALDAKVAKDEQVIYVRDHGIACDGVTDDTTAINALFTASPAGARFKWPSGSDCKISAPIVVSKAMTMAGYGAKITNTAGTETIRVSAGTSSVTVRGFTLAGPGSGTLQALGIGVHSLGTVASPVTDLVLEDLKVSAFGKAGMWLEGMSEFTIRRNIVSDIAYAGVMVLSGLSGVITGNKVRDLVQPAGYVNSYGIALSRDSSQNVSLTPRTSDVVVSNNLVDGVPLWEGIDTHGGARLSILGNQVYNCLVGIAMLSGNNEFGVDTFGPKQVVVSGNTVRAGVTNGTARAGIQFIGAGSAAGSVTDAATGLVTGNIVEDHGLENTSGGSGIILRYSEGVSIAGNNIKNPSLSGVLIDHTNSGFSCTGNNITDVWTNSLSFSAGILVNSTYNVGYIGANNGIRGSKSATIVNQRGVYINSGAATGSAITVGSNDFATFSLPVVDSANIGVSRFDGKSVGFFGVTPATRPTATAEIKAALAGFGLLTDGSASPLDLDGGELTAGGVRLGYVAKTAAYTLTAADTFVRGDATGGAFSLTLPTAVGVSGRRYTLKRINSGANAVTVATTSSQTIDGASTYVLSAAGSVVEVASNGTNWEVVSFTSSAGASADVQTFLASGTWTMPAGAKSVQVEMIGGGGGAGSGAQRASGTLSTGGGGGGGGGIVNFTLAAAALTSTVAVTVGTGGAGGAAVSTVDTNGSNGSNGVSSLFGSYLKAWAGSSGNGGSSTVAGAGGSGNIGTSVGGTGASSPAAATVPGSPTISAGSPGGAAGGGITAGTPGTPANGGPGQTSWAGTTAGNGGVVDTTSPVAGVSVTAGMPIPGASGGGGAASVTTAAQAGAAAGSYGCGGSGGGASRNGNNSGAGSDGAPGIVRVTTYF